MVERYKSDAQYKPGINPYRYAEGITTPAAPKLTPPPPAPNLRRPRTTPGLAKAAAAKQEGSQLTQMLGQWSDTLYEQAAEKIAIEAEAEGIEAGNHTDENGNLIPPELDTRNINVRSKAYYKGQVLAYKSATQTDIITSVARFELESPEDDDDYSRKIEAYRAGLTEGLTGKNKLWANNEINTRAAHGLVRIRERALQTSRENQAAEVRRNAEALGGEALVDAFNGETDESFIKYSQIENALLESVDSLLMDRDKADDILSKLRDEITVQTLKGVFIRTIKNEGLSAAEEALQRLEEMSPDDMRIRVWKDEDGNLDPNGENVDYLSLTPALRDRLIREAKTEISSSRTRFNKEKALANAERSAVNALIAKELGNIENIIKNGEEPVKADMAALDKATQENPKHRSRFTKWKDILQRVQYWKSQPLLKVEQQIALARAQDEVSDISMRTLLIIEKMYKSRQAETTGDNRAAVERVVNEMKTAVALTSPGNTELRVDLEKLDELVGAVKGTSLYEKLEDEKYYYKTLSKILGLSKEQRVAMMDQWEKSKKSDPYRAELFARLEPLHNALIADKETEIAEQVGHMRTALLSDKKIDKEELQALEDAARNTKYEKPLALALQKYDALNSFQMMPVVTDDGSPNQNDWLLEQRGKTFGAREAEVIDHLAAFHDKALTRINAGKGLDVAIDMGILDERDLPALNSAIVGSRENFSAFLSLRADAAAKAQAGFGPQTVVGLEADFDPEAETRIPGRRGVGFNVPALRPAEVDLLVEQMTAASPDAQVQILETLVENLDTQGAMLIFGQFDKKGATVLAMAGSLMTDDAPGVAREVVIGRTMVNAPFMPENKKLRLEIMQELMGAMPVSTNLEYAQLDALTDTIVANIAYKAAVNMSSTDSSYDPTSFKDNYETTLDAAVDDVTGGIITVLWDESSGWGDAEYRLFAPRRGWDSDDFVQARRAITAEHIVNMGGLSEHHDKAAVLAGIRGSIGLATNQGSVYKFEPVGGLGERGKGYYLKQSGADEKYVAGKDGKAFVFRFPEGKYWPDRTPSVKSFFGFKDTKPSATDPGAGMEEALPDAKRDELAHAAVTSIIDGKATLDIIDGLPQKTADEVVRLLEENFNVAGEHFKPSGDDDKGSTPYLDELEDRLRGKKLAEGKPILVKKKR